MRSPNRILRPSAVLLVLATALVGGLPAHGGKKKNAACPAQQVFIQEVSAGRHKGIKPDETLPAFRDALEATLTKKGLTLVNDASALGADDVSLKVSVRAWTDRARQTGRVTTGMAARVDVHQGEERLWYDHIAPGERSRLTNFNNGNPKDLGKRVAAMVVEACSEGWDPTD